MFCRWIKCYCKQRGKWLWGEKEGPSSFVFVVLYALGPILSFPSPLPTQPHQIGLSCILQGGALGESGGLREVRENISPYLPITFLLANGIPQICASSLASTGSRRESGILGGKGRNRIWPKSPLSSATRSCFQQTSHPTPTPPPFHPVAVFYACGQSNVITGYPFIMQWASVVSSLELQQCAASCTCGAGLTAPPVELFHQWISPIRLSYKMSLN